MTLAYHIIKVANKMGKFHKPNACLKTPEVLQGNQQHVERVFQRNVAPSWLLSPTLDPMRRDRWHQLKHLTHEMT